MSVQPQPQPEPHPADAPSAAFVMTPRLGAPTHEQGVWHEDGAHTTACGRLLTACPTLTPKRGERPSCKACDTRHTG